MTYELIAQIVAQIVAVGIAAVLLGTVVVGSRSRSKDRRDEE